MAKNNYINPIVEIKCFGTKTKQNILMWIFIIVWFIVTGLSQGYINMNDDMECQKFLKLTVLSDNIVSFGAIIMMLFEKTITEYENYSQVERSALRLLKRDQEKVDQIMEQVFNKTKKNEFDQYDKTNPDEDEEHQE